MRAEEMISMMSEINEKYVEEARTFHEKAKRKKRVFALYFAAAACVVMAIGVFALYKTGLFTAPPTPGNGDFVISGSVLTAYTGGGTVVVIPSGVSSIGPRAFSSSSSSSIKTIELTAEVEEIDDEAFAGLNSLEQITVPDDNPVFVSKDGYVVKKDGTLCIGFLEVIANDPTESSQRFFELIGELSDNFDNPVKKLVINEAVFDFLYFDAEPNEYGHADSNRCAVSSVAYKGQRFTFDDPFPLYGNFQLVLFEQDGKLIFGRQYYYDFEQLVILSEDHALDVIQFIDGYNAGKPEYARSLFEFRPGENGHIDYVRRSCKIYSAISFQTFDQIAKYVTSWDEFSRETGYITIENGGIVLHPEEHYTLETDIRFPYSLISEKDMTVRELIESRFASGYMDYNGSEFRAFATFDDYIAYNRTRYVDAQ